MGVVTVVTHQITIPNWHPAKVNQLLKSHWVASRLKKADFKMVWAYTRGVPEAITKRSVKLTICVTGRGRNPDPDAFTKSLNDALVKCRMLVDDGAEWVVNLPVEIIRAKRKETIIYLADIPTIKKLPPGYAMNSIVTQRVKPRQKGRVDA